MTKYSEKEAEKLAKALAVTCVRNTFLETLHSGTSQESKIRDGEMKTLMKEIVNKLYTILMNLDDETFMRGVLTLGGQYSTQWDKAELVPGFIISSNTQADFPALTDKP